VVIGSRRAFAIKKKKRVGGMAQVVECLPRKLKGLSLKPSTAKKKKKKKSQ
jgi:hypothetical protein